MAKWWPWSKEKPAELRPEQGYFVSGARDDYAINSAVRSLTPEKLATAMRAAEQGDTEQQFEIFEIVEQDPHVLSVMKRRRDAIICRELQVVSGREGDARADEAADLCRNLLLGEDGEEGVRDWSAALFDMTDAIGKGFSLAQIAWEMDGSRFIPRRLIRWPQREVILGDQHSNAQLQLGADPDEIRLVTDTDSQYGEPLAPRWNWCVHVSKAWSTHLSRAALYRSITWFYLFKRFSFKDWSIFLERYGMPLRVGKYHNAATDPEKQALLTAVKLLGRDAACIMPQLSTIELLESKVSGTAGGVPHPTMIVHCNDEISKAVWGNTMAATQGDKGARSAKEAYADDELELTNSDCRALGETIRRELFTPMVRLNMGDGVVIPRAVFVAQEAENLLERIQVDEKLANMGLEMSKAQLREVYGRDEPVDETDSLKKAAPAPSPLQRPGQPPVAPNDEDESEPPADEELPNVAQLAEVLALDVAAYARARKRSADWIVARMMSRRGQ
jgi:phage gp29-like protein